MAVQKSKPKSTPHALLQSLDRAAAASEKTVRTTREAIQRSRDLMLESRSAIEQAKQLQRKQAS